MKKTLGGRTVPHVTLELLFETCAKFTRDLEKIAILTEVVHTTPRWLE